MSTDPIKQQTGAFITRFFKNQEIHDNDDIFALGFVNSLFAIQLVGFVEKQFQISIGAEDLDIANFRSINSIADLVRRKMAS